MNLPLLLRINRYIMECKLSLKKTPFPRLYELIDTLWNVNLAGGCEYLAMEVELIDTLWNVNRPEYVARLLYTLN